MGEFFKETEDNIYALWEEGKVPVEEVIGFFKLKKHHLCPKDWENYEELLKAAGGMSESDSENDNAASVDDDGRSSTEEDNDVN